MELLHFMVEGAPRLGLAIGGKIFDLARAGAALGLPAPETLEQAMAMDFGRLAELAEAVFESGLGALPEERVICAPCVPRPQKILCVGLNYRSHALESGLEVPAEPVIFSKFSNALAGHGQDIPLPAVGRELDYEAELVVVMGRRARCVPEDRALEYVFGYTVGNDLSVRDLQFRSSQWLIGKSPDAFAPIGPRLVTRDQIADPQNLNIACTVNGEIRQSANTGMMIFSCAQIIAYISQFMTLEPGDILFTGTPQGVAMGYPKGRQPWLRAGDRVACQIEGVGRLENRLVARD